MKRLLFLTFTLLMVFSLSSCGLCDRKDSGEDRYQIITTEKLILKFDTKTGDTWKRDGTNWIFIQEVKEDDQEDSDHSHDYQLCKSMINIYAPLQDIRNTEAFGRLSSYEKMHIYESFFQEHKLWRDDIKDTVLMRQLHKAMREDLSID